MYMIIEKNIDFANKLHNLVSDKKFIMSENLRNELEIDLYQGKSYMKKFSLNDVVKKCGKIKYNKKDIHTYQLTTNAIEIINKINKKCMIS